MKINTPSVWSEGTRVSTIASNEQTSELSLPISPVATARSTHTLQTLALAPVTSQNTTVLFAEENIQFNGYGLII